MANPLIYVWHLAVVRPWPVVFDEAAAEVADLLALKPYHPVR